MSEQHEKSGPEIIKENLYLTFEGLLKDRDILSPEFKPSKKAKENEIDALARADSEAEEAQARYIIEQLRDNTDPENYKFRLIGILNRLRNDHVIDNDLYEDLTNYIQYGKKRSTQD